MAKNRQKGIIGTIALVVIALAFLQIVFHVDVIGFFKSAKVTEFIDYVKRFVSIVWNKFLITPLKFIWSLLEKSVSIFKGWVDNGGN